MKNALPIAIGVVVVVLAVAGILFVSGRHAPVNAQAPQQVPVLLTDPPHVPTGTSALIITYTSVMVQTGSGTWINASGSGSINLMDLVNATTVIGTANLTANTVVDSIRFSVASANIVVNGVSSGVTLPNSTITAHLSGKGNVNASGGLLLDFTPTIVTISTAGNATDYIMVPSVRAVSIGNVTIHRVGERTELSNDYRHSLERSGANISISSANIISFGNYTRISVTVNDSSNVSVTIKHILVFGNYTMDINMPGLQANASVNASVDDIVNSIGVGGRSNAVIGVIGGYDDQVKLVANASAEANTPDSSNTFVNQNATASTSDSSNTFVNENASSHMNTGETGAYHGNESEHVYGSGSMRYENDHANALNLLISQNGTLYLPFQFSASGEAEQNGPGYTIAAGSSETFTFNGIVSHGNGIVGITATAGDNYTIAVSGSDGVHAVTTVTAS